MTGSASEGGSDFAYVTSNENALHCWALQYGEKVTVTEPAALCSKIGATVEDMTKRYKNQR